ncbi:Uncharacterised protein [Mycobacteroides abscessus subsp. abscessus]|nr:Uncharacterised protein [Mycobacteroides abscessus subsp. abscessus]
MLQYKEGKAKRMPMVIASIAHLKAGVTYESDHFFF